MAVSAIGLFAQLSDQCEYGHIHGDHDSTYSGTEDDDDHRFQGGHEVADRSVDLLFVEGRDLGQHRFQSAGFSPTPIIETTMLGNTPDSFNGSTIVRPSEIAFFTLRIASSIIALPDVRAVMSRQSKIGTPLAISVAIVCVKRATAIFRNSGPNTGAFNIKPSAVYRPFGVR